MTSIKADNIVHADCVIFQMTKKYLSCINCTNKQKKKIQCIAVVVSEMSLMIKTSGLRNCGYARIIVMVF